MLRQLKTIVNILLISGPGLLLAQSAQLREAPEIAFPTVADGNSSAFWLNDRLHLFTSVGWPQSISTTASLFEPWETQVVDTSEMLGRTTWMEAAWADEDGTVFCWYHHEPAGLFGGSYLTAPVICAAVSFDGGKTVHDLGTILESGDPIDGTAQNGFFAGGHGDFSVVLDRERKYFYFFFTNYGGSVETQGIVVARMAFEDRFEPVGKLQKYHNGEWTEPGLGGAVTPIFPAVRTWQAVDPDSYWGPGVHWNTHLNRWVMLLNHASGEPGWAQEGIYVSFCEDITDPASWKTPRKILDGSALPGWSTFYPQVMGLEAGGTDTLAGEVARFFVAGHSSWEIVFSPNDPDDGSELPTEPTEPTPGSTPEPSPEPGPGPDGNPEPPPGDVPPGDGATLSTEQLLRLLIQQPPPGD